MHGMQERNGAIELPAGARARKGDKVTIAAELPGIGLATIAGEWRVAGDG